MISKVIRRINHKSIKTKLLLVSLTLTFSGLLYVLEYITRQKLRITNHISAHNPSLKRIEFESSILHSKFSLSSGSNSIRLNTTSKHQQISIPSTTIKTDETSTQFLARIKNRMEKRRKHLRNKCESLSK